LQLEAQEKIINIGFNLAPEFILGGHYEAIVLLNCSRRVKSKLSIGYTNAGDNSIIRSRCLIADFISDRKETGLFLKLNADYAIVKSKIVDVYSGGGIFYTKFETSGTARSGLQLSDSGDILAPGFRLGLRTEKLNPLLLDLGVELYYYGKDKHQIDTFCKGGIPGIGDPSHGDYLFSWYLHVLF